VEGGPDLEPLLTREWLIANGWATARVREAGKTPTTFAEHVRDGLIPICSRVATS
jgi:hypothetical protein